MKKQPLYLHIAENIRWYLNLKKSPEKAEQFLGECLSRIWWSEARLPRGSGIDCGCEILLDESTEKKIKIYFAFHHIDEFGGYNGWTKHNLILTPDFGGFEMRITGPDKDGIKEYLYGLFDTELRKEVEI